MKVLLGVAAAALLLAPAALAQTAPAGESTNCAGFALPPSLPDGATASSSAMATGATEYEAWHTATEAKKALCQTDIATLRAQLNTMVEAYNQAEQQRFAAQNAWAGDVAEYNGRGGAGRRQRGGVLTRPDH